MRRRRVPSAPAPRPPTRSAGRARRRRSRSGDAPAQRRPSPAPRRPSSARRPARAGSRPTLIIGLVWRSERSASRTRSSAAGETRPPRLAVVDQLGPDPERRRDERREGLDVRAHHDDVARLQGGIGGQQAEDHVAHDIDLPGPAVAGVDLDAAIAGVDHRPADRRQLARRARIRLLQQRKGVAAGRSPSPAGNEMMAVVNQLTSARANVSCNSRTSRPSDESSRCATSARRRIARAGAGRHLADGGQPLPQGGAGMQQPQVDVAVLGERRQDGELARAAAGSGRRATAAAASSTAEESSRSCAHAGAKPLGRTRQRQAARAIGARAPAASSGPPAAARRRRRSRRPPPSRLIMDGPVGRRNVSNSSAA